MDWKNTAKEITFWTEYAVPSEPHQELIPWIGLFRPLAHTNWTWVEAFGDEYRL